jgi:glycosyltransferase involved in cell wall biosynthesis
VAPQVVRDGETGYLIRIGDVSGLVSALRSLAEDRRQLLALRTAAQAEVRRMSWQDIAARTVTLYQTLLRFH